ncbi:MAG: hypothetical protein RBR53_09355 [Desulforegulaceae bacterium]|nr:hypothetical protein [Desulforegulaceae bacterium]
MLLKNSPFEITNYAPVLIPTLNRYSHLKNCICSLSSCIHAEDTDLFIALDYPFKIEHWEGYNKIVKFIEKIEGFRRVIIIKRNQNFGARENIRDARSMIFENYDRLIISEDDNIFSKDFLRFVNIGLEKYKHRHDIFAINGYNYPIEVPADYKDDVYLWQGMSAWGFGIWKEKWEELESNDEIVLSNIKKFLKSYRKILNYNRVANHYVRSLLWMLRLQKVHGDGHMCFHQFTNNMYSIFPTISRVRNLGHDGSGLHCNEKKKDLFSDQPIYDKKDNIYNLPISIKPNDTMNKILYKHFKKSLISQFVILVLIVFTFLKLKE